MHGIVENRVRPDETSAGIEHAQATDSRVNCITAGGRLARPREIKVQGERTLQNSVLGSMQSTRSTARILQKKHNMSQ